MQLVKEVGWQQSVLGSALAAEEPHPDWASTYNNSYVYCLLLLVDCLGFLLRRGIGLVLKSLDQSGLDKLMEKYGHNDLGQKSLCFNSDSAASHQ